jgi:hypothetical protein
MIVFDLDGTLADCEHRRHFVDPEKSINHLKSSTHEGKYFNVFTNEIWQPNWKAFYEACDLDTPIATVIELWNNAISLGMMRNNQIWSGRCESVREKTVIWLQKNLLCFESEQLKMRPIGDSTPDDILKERWLNERCADLIEAQMQGRFPVIHDIEFVFDDRPKVVRMWRRRGIFVFNCCQHDGDT